MSPAAFHVMAKPAGATCNLHCEYCFYYDKQNLYPSSEPFMNETVLESYVRNYYAAHQGPQVSFAWQGGEPTLAGVDFFRRAVNLQRKHLPEGWQFENALQTNGICINEEWATFLAAEDFLVGLSWDGPGALHDHYRGLGTSAQVQRAWETMQRHGVKVNTLTVLHRENAQAPREVYHFLREQGVEHMQFIPLVRMEEAGELTLDSVDPLDYGRFLIHAWHQWLQADVGRVFIQTFEGALAALAGLPPGLCVFARTCGNNIIVEHNGDVYPCDHFVEEKRRLGNIANDSLDNLVTSSAQVAFGEVKHNQLHSDCLGCDVLSLCWGGCPKDRSDGKNLLCEGYKLFFRYTKPYHERLLKSLRQGQAAPVAAPTLWADVEALWKDLSRNDPCPCGSGRKFKRCCADFFRM